MLARAVTPALKSGESPEKDKRLSSFTQDQRHREEQRKNAWKQRARTQGSVSTYRQGWGGGPLPCRCWWGLPAAYSSYTCPLRREIKTGWESNQEYKDYFIIYVFLGFLLEQISAIVIWKKNTVSRNVKLSQKLWYISLICHYFGRLGHYFAIPSHYFYGTKLLYFLQVIYLQHQFIILRDTSK